MLVVRLAFGVPGSRNSAKALISVSLLQLYVVIILRASYRGSDAPGSVSELHCVIQTKYAAKLSLNINFM